MIESTIRTGNSIFARLLSTGSLGLLALCGFSGAASAQQITYYNFNAPQANAAETSYACTAPVAGQPSNILFCFNGSGVTAVPAYNNTTPNGASPTYDVLLTPPTGGQNSSIWFAVPQQVSSGFTSYFAFQFTPNPQSYATADGMAFVLQNSSGGTSSTTADGTTCTAYGAGPTIYGSGGGGCIGYGGIDNSLAIEFDTYQNGWDPIDIPGSLNDNHVAVQNCGPGLANSPDHTGSCLVTLGAPPTGTPLTPAINNPAALVPSVTLADGNVHQVVVSYSGPTEAIPNLLQVFIDPAFVTGTHTPVAGSVPTISGIYNVGSPNNISLMNGTSAYVGFTSATGGAFEQHELLEWTYTPHTPVTQSQPLNPPGTPTVFPFGAHTYTVTYPTAVDPTGFNMTVTANTITPLLFQSLVSTGPFAGSVCQVYDETGGNCVIYSVSCTQNGISAVCPSVPASDTNPQDLILVTSAFNNSTPLVTPGFLQGDPLYTQLTSITGTGGANGVATVTCTGECSVTVGQTVTIANASVPGYNATVTVLTVPAPNEFTYASTVATPSTGGYLTSNNVINIFTSFTDSLPIDSGVSGKTKNFSDFVVTSPTSSVTTLGISATPATYGSPVVVTVTANSANGNPPGNVLLTVDSLPTVYTQPLIATTGSATMSTATFSLPGLTGGGHTVYASYPANGAFQGATTSLPINITATPLASVTPGSLNFGTLYLGGVGIQSVTLSNVGDAPMSINEPFLFDVGNGDSKEFIALNLCPKTLAVAKSCQIYVGFFAGPSYNTQTAMLKIMDNAPGSPQTVSLTANVINPQASFSPRSLAFASQSVGTSTTQSVTVTNTGATTLSISKAGVAGKNAGDFSVTNGCPATLAPGASCTLGVGFMPTAKGARSASIVLSDNVQCGSSQLSVSGTGK